MSCFFVNSRMGKEHFSSALRNTKQEHNTIQDSVGEQLLPSHGNKRKYMTKVNASHVKSTKV